jgi:thiol:disulfide interchange protein DsbD
MKHLKWILLLALIAGGLFILSIKTTPKQMLAWQNYSPDAVKASLSKPVLIDFSAEWCAGCHELDRKVFANPDVAPLLQRFVPLRVDATNPEDPKIEALFEQYNISGLPTVIFLNSKGEEVKEARVEGSVSKSSFLKSASLVQ